MTDLPPRPEPDRVTRDLLAWFRANRRALPWRTTRDPYRILVAEVMLQQTQVDRVVPYYERWLERFPDLEALAFAPVADVIQLWAGLGYNRRAVNLQRTAQAVVETFGGEFPREVDQLKTLPGIGPYSAGAIACFAFEQDVAFIDTNMRRVLHRLFIGSDVPEPLVNDRAVLEIAADVLPAGSSWEWNQALIEFGALHCSARKPACVVCPLGDACRARPTVQADLAALAPGQSRKREAPFAGSSRYYRGRVLAALRDADRSGASMAEIGQQVREGFTPDDLPWLIDLVRGLERDGLARIAEEPAPGYDASDPLAVRVALP